MSAHSQTHPGMMPMSASASSVGQAGREGQAPASWFEGVRGSLARFGHRLIAATVAGRMERALAEIEHYDYRLGAEMRAAIARNEHPLI